MVGVDDLLGAIAQTAVGHREGKGIALVGGAEDRAAQTHHRGVEPRRVEVFRVGRLAQQTHRTVADAEDFPSIGRMGAHRHCANYRVEAATVTPARQQTDTFGQFKVPSGWSARIMQPTT